MRRSIQKKANLSFSFAFTLALIFSFVLILPLVACPLWGQVVQKKQLTAGDYPKFGELDFDKVSTNGDWASFSMIYKNGLDTLFVKNTSTLKNYSIALGSNPSFLGNNHFVYETKQGLHLLNLNTEQEQTIFSSIQYSCSSVFNQIVVLTRNPATLGDLLVIDENGNTLKKITGVTQFLMSPCQKKILFTTKQEDHYSMGILELGKQINTNWIIDKNSNDFKMLTWEKTGKAFAFLSTENLDTDNNTLFYYIINQNQLHELDDEKQAGFPQNKTIDDLGKYSITISADLSKVFFGIRSRKKSNQKNSAVKLESTVEVWNANDKWIYPMEKKMGQFSSNSNLAVWFPLLEQFIAISSDELPKAMLAGNEQYAVLSNPQSYEPQFDYNGPRDFFIMDLNSGKKELLLKKKSVTDIEPIPVPSPGGRFITYFSNNNWWVYNLNTKIHTNVTGKMGIKLTGPVRTLYRDTPYGIEGWTDHDQEILLYDQYDLWVIKPDGTHFKRITYGREKQIQFRIFKSTYEEGFQVNYDGKISKTISLAAGLLLEAKGNDGKTGYFKWQQKTGEKSIVYKASYIDKLRSVSNKNNFIYREQNFNQSPRLIFQKGRVIHSFFQSNPQQAKYNWGKTELLSYHNSKGEKLSSVLCYPADYDPKKKYPMIVHVYERQVHKLYKYSNPTLESNSGFNSTILTSQGYFVLYPDIVYEEQNEGLAAVDCTVSATNEIISRGLVYPNKIGLIGHSFGGYETNYIITQTKLFTAAIAGSAITDINSYYLTVNWDIGRPTMNYFQNDHFKMIKSPYEIPGIFARNSPIIYADQITTPLLSFTGKLDNHVDWHQSVELYLALRRLSKKHIMLIYPNEGHSIVNPINKVDLTNRVIQWFGYYLKDEIPAVWIKDGTQ